MHRLKFSLKIETMSRVWCFDRITDVCGWLDAHAAIVNNQTGFEMMKALPREFVSIFDGSDKSGAPYACTVGGTTRICLTPITAGGRIGFAVTVESLDGGLTPSMRSIIQDLGTRHPRLVVNFSEKEMPIGMVLAAVTLSASGQNALSAMVLESTPVGDPTKDEYYV